MEQIGFPGRLKHFLQVFFVCDFDVFFLGGGAWDQKVLYKKICGEH